MTPKLPSALLSDLLSGVTAWEDADPSIRNWATFEIHRAAVEVLAMPKEKRDGFFKAVPVHLQDMIKAECNRVWLFRRSA